MKKFKLFKMLAVLVVLITCINTVWGGQTDFINKDADDVYIKYSKNGGDATQQNIAGDGQADIVLGTVSSLVITEFRAVAKNKDSKTCAIWMAYGINTTRNGTIDASVSASHNTDGYTDWTWDSYWGCQQFKNSSVNLDLLSEKDPGDYWYDFYFTLQGNTDNSANCYSDVAKWWNNGGMYHMSYTIPSRDLTITRANTNGTVTGSETAVKKGHAYTITATPNDHYAFTGWTTSDSHITIANANSATTTVTFDDLSANATVTANFEYQWAIQGSGTEMGAWETYNYLPFSGTEDTYSGTITLAANSVYLFKIRDRRTGAYWGYGDSDYQLAYVGQSNEYAHDLENDGSKQNLVIMTAKSGTYTFTWNSDTKRLTVAFPDQSHPNTDNIYFKNSGASAYSNVYAHIWNGGTGTTGGGRLPKLPTCTFDNQTYYYAAIGNNNKCLFANSEDIKTGSPSKTSDQSSVNSKVGQYYDLSSDTWKDFTATLTLTHHIATNSPTPASIEVTYNSDNNLTGDVLTKDPTNANYSFQGYYTAIGGGGDLLINTSGAVQNVTGYTSSGKWIRKSSAEVFAKWTQSVTLNMNGGDDSNSSVTLTYNSASHAAISTPSRANYTFAGWYTAASDGSLVIATDGTMQANVTNYTGAGGIWTRNNATNVLYAQWTEKKHTVTIAAGSNGSVDPTSVSNVGVVTTSGDITATGNTGYKFVNWTLVDGVTLADGYVNTDETIRINATADSKTITANFTAKQCAITFDKEGGEGGSNSTTATYGVAMSDVEIPHQIGYKFDGYFDGDNGTGNQYYKADGTSYTAWNKNTEEDTKLYAKWTADNNEFTGVDGDWTKGTNWSSGTAPTDDWSAVTISKPVTITDAYVHIGSLTIGANGKLTIAADGALEVAGTITNDATSKLVINSTGSSQGALIFNSTGSTAANVNMTMNAEDEMFQFIAIPVSLVSVNPTFAGTGKYTYVWSNSEHTWERRGYYDDIYSFEAVLLKGQGTAEFNGNLVSTGNITYSGSYSSTGYNNVYMYGNSWTAPIKLSAGMYDNVSIGIMKGTNNSWDGGIVNDVIPALQAFGVAVGSSKATGSFTINYDTDVRNPSYPNEPLRAPQRQTADVRPIAIYVSGNDMQTRIRLLEDATRFTDDLDAGWEAYYLAGQGLAGEMYAVGPEAKMNVLATSNLEGTVVGFVPGQATDYTISFTGDGKGYYLNDIATGESTLIDEANTYNFKSDENTNATRFVVSKMPLMPTGVDEVADGSKARKQMIDGTLYIIRDGRIYKVDGALVK